MPLMILTAAVSSLMPPAVGRIAARWGFARDTSDRLSENLGTVVLVILGVAAPVFVSVMLISERARVIISSANTAPIEAHLVVGMFCMAVSGVVCAAVAEAAQRWKQAPQCRQVTALGAGIAAIAMPLLMPSSLALLVPPEVVSSVWPF